MLISLQAHSRRNFDPKPNTLRTVIGLCLVLLMLLAVVHVAFGHSVATDADHCQLCIVMHSVVPFVVMAVCVVMVRIRTAALMPLEVRSICRSWHPTLFNRPPPAGC